VFGAWVFMGVMGVGMLVVVCVRRGWHHPVSIGPNIAIRSCSRECPAVFVEEFELQDADLCRSQPRPLRGRLNL
jgi:hypothetical protein